MFVHHFAQNITVPNKRSALLSYVHPGQKHCLIFLQQLDWRSEVLDLISRQSSQEPSWIFHKPIKGKFETDEPTLDQIRTSEYILPNN